MTDRPFKFQPEEDGSLTVETAVFQALGAAPASPVWPLNGGAAQATSRSLTTSAPTSGGLHRCGPGRLTFDSTAKATAGR